MPSLEGLQQAAQTGAAQVGQTDNFARQAAAQQAASLFKSGDIKGALSTMAAIDPEHVQQLIGQFQQFDPSTNQALSQGKAQGQTQGQYNVETPAGANPRQLLDTQLAGQAKIAGIKASAQGSKPAIRKDENSPTGFSMITPQGVFPFDAYSGAQPTKPSKGLQVADASGDAMKPEAPKLRPNEDIDSNGEKVMLSPKQQSVIKETRKTFDSETKDLVKSLDNLSQAEKNIQDNIPGQGTIEKLRILKGVVGGRINQQEFAAFGKGQGILNVIDNAISEAEGKGMSPGVQKLMNQMVKAAQEVTSKEYDSHLQNAIQRNPEVDPLILKKRLIGSSGPTLHQEIVKKVSGLPPQDQAAFNWAHDNLNDSRAKAIIQKLGF